MSEPTSTFIRVRCAGCKNEQVIFSKAAKEIACLVCNEPVAKPTGGKTNVTAQVLEVLD